MKKLLSALLVAAITLSVSATISYAEPRDNPRTGSREQKPKQSQSVRKRPESAPQRPATQHKPANNRQPSVTAHKPTQQPPKTSSPSRRPTASSPTNSTNNTIRHPSPNKPSVSNSNNVQRPTADNSVQRPSRRPPSSSNNDAHNNTQASGSKDRPNIKRPTANKPTRPATSTIQAGASNDSNAASTRPTRDNNLSATRHRRPSTPLEGRPAPRPTHKQHSDYRPNKITGHAAFISHPPRIGAHTRPSKYYSSRSGYVHRGNYVMHNNYIVVRPGRISYVFHPLVYYRPLPIYYRPYYYHRYHDYYHGYSDFYILGRLLLAFANAIERNNQQEQIDRLRDDIYYLQRKLDLQDEQLTTNNKEEFYSLLDELGLDPDEIDDYDLDRDYLLYGGS